MVLGDGKMRLSVREEIGEREEVEGTKVWKGESQECCRVENGGWEGSRKGSVVRELGIGK